MLDELEWQYVKSLSEGNMPNYITLSEKNMGKELAAIELHKVMVDAYNELTNAQISYDDWYLIEYFRLSDYGPECQSCQHPLRSPKAAFCANCGAVCINTEID